MKTYNSKTWVALGAVVAGLTLATPVSAAAPDGIGPWSDGVAVVNQGMKKNGSPVLPERSDPWQALGLAEGTQDTGTFYSLGMGGDITLAFQNGVSSGTFVVESTWTDFWYPTETAKVEVSVDGLSYQEIGNVTKEHGQVEIPEGIGCALFVRITDTSNPDLFEPTADGFDVDGVRSVGLPCVNGGETPACFEISSLEADKADAAILDLTTRKAESYKAAASKLMSTEVSRAEKFEQAASDLMSKRETFRLARRR